MTDQAPKAPDRAPTPATLRARQRLRTQRHFRRVYQRGQRASGHWLTVVVLPLPEAGDHSASRLGVSVSKDHGGAVRRNKLKRLLREAWRLARARRGADPAPTRRELPACRTAGRTRAAAAPRTRQARRSPAPQGPFLRWLLLLPVWLYRRLVSPWKPATCRFRPTCSCYAMEALRTHGALRGSWLTARRLLRCHPFTEPDFDPVPPVLTATARGTHPPQPH
jgi:putative membrane protein insertion efficiency factor/ribonuclease P protein component